MDTKTKLANAKRFLSEDMTESAFTEACSATLGSLENLLKRNGLTGRVSFSNQENQNYYPSDVLQEQVNTALQYNVVPPGRNTEILWAMHLWHRAIRLKKAEIKQADAERAVRLAENMVELEESA